MNDDILKYIAGLMDETEKVKFEERLDNDAELLEEYKMASGKLGALKETANIKFDDRYLNNVVVKAKEITAKGGKPGIGADLSLALQGFFTFAFVFFLMFRIDLVSEQDLFVVSDFEIARAISSTDENVLGTYLDSYSYDTESIGDVFSNSELSDYELSDLVDYQNNSDYQLGLGQYLEDINETDLDDLLNSLKEKKIL